MRNPTRIALLVLGIALLAMGCRGREFWMQALSITLADIDISGIPAGDYIGAYQNGVEVRVKASVRDHRLSGIKILEHKTQLGKKAEAITGAVIAKQSLQVDVIAGATMSSLAILKAIENALQKGIPLPGK